MLYLELPHSRVVKLSLIFFLVLSLCFLFRSLIHLELIVMFECIVQNLTLPQRGLAFGIVFWKVIPKPLNVLPDRSVLVCLGAWGQTR